MRQRGTRQLCVHMPAARSRRLRAPYLQGVTVVLSGRPADCDLIQDGRRRVGQLRMLCRADQVPSLQQAPVPESMDV